MYYYSIHNLLIIYKKKRFRLYIYRKKRTRQLRHVKYNKINYERKIFKKYFFACINIKLNINLVVI